MIDTKISSKIKTSTKRPPPRTAVPPRRAITDRVTKQANPVPVDRVELSPQARSEKTSTSSEKWSNSWGLEGATNAHNTNTKEQFSDAMKGDYDWFEGDIREEIDRPGRLEMRHDKGREPGDNLTLTEWLNAGRDSGRGLKLDVKESEFMPQILDQVTAAGIPSDRLMFNLGFSESKKYGEEIRERFPDSIMAINPPSNELKTEDLEKMGKLADTLGGQSTFPIREDILTDEAIDKLSQHGSVSVWNSPGFSIMGGDSVDKRHDKLIDRGVTGVIDLRDDESLVAKGRDFVKSFLASW